MIDVAIVEDQERLRAGLCALLEGEPGFRVIGAYESMERALAALEQRPPAVLLADIGLPGMTGYELARRLRTSHAAIRLIALTGYGQVSDLEAARDAGFDAHCSKPVATAALLELIDGDVTAPAQTPADV